MTVVGTTVTPGATDPLVTGFAGRQASGSSTAVAFADAVVAARAGGKAAGDENAAPEQQTTDAADADAAGGPGADGETPLPLPVALAASVPLAPLPAVPSASPAALGGHVAAPDVSTGQSGTTPPAPVDQVPEATDATPAAFAPVTADPREVVMSREPAAGTTATTTEITTTTAVEAKPVQEPETRAPRPVPTPPVATVPPGVPGAAAASPPADATAQPSATPAAAAPGTFPAPVAPTADPTVAAAGGSRGAAPAQDAPSPAVAASTASPPPPPVAPPAPTPAAAPIPTPAAAEAPAPARPALPPQQIAGPLIALARAAEGDHRMTLTVSPERLGPVTVRAHISGGSIRIELHAPSDLGRDALRAILPDLRRDLAAAAPHASLAVSTQDAGSSTSGSAGQQSTWGGGAHSPRGTWRPEAPVPPASVPSPPPPTATAPPSGGIDVFA